MLQRAVRPQLAGLRRLLAPWDFGAVRSLMEVKYLGPLKKIQRDMEKTTKHLSPNSKHWFIGGSRSLAVAVSLLKQKEVIAVPTDTIYGLATLAQSSQSVGKIYELKGRDMAKPLAICVSDIAAIRIWAEVEHLPRNFLAGLLPGPVTIVLKRKPDLNPNLNPDFDTVGIRVPGDKFVRSICKVLRQPLALTSANLSNQPSSLTPQEFTDLWPKLGGIFYAIPKKNALDETKRVGSTIVDLSVPGKYKFVRKGVGIERVLYFLELYGIKNADEQSETVVE